MEGQRKFMGTLWNTYAFFVLYANIDEFDAMKYELEYEKLSVIDKWLLSKLNTLVKTVDSNLENYKIPETARALQDFVDDMSNWYVRRSRERFWVKGMPQDKINAYMTLYTALVTVAKAAAPMIPFMTESIYRNLVCKIDQTAPESVHLCDFPTANEAYIDKKLEKNMELVLDVVVLGRAARNTANIKNRQPIAKIYVKSEKELSEFYQEIIREELNCKEICFTQDVSDFTSYSFKPQLRTLGQKYGKKIAEIKAVLANLDGNAAKKELDTVGTLTILLNDGDICLSSDDLLIETKQSEQYVSMTDNGITVVIDTNITEELLEEGFVREIISKIQAMRKEADFNVIDHIVVYERGNYKVEKIISDHMESIKNNVLADEVRLGEMDGFIKQWNMNGETVVLGVQQVKI